MRDAGGEGDDLAGPDVLRIATPLLVYFLVMFFVPVLIGLVNVALKLRDRWLPGETGEIGKVAN